MFRQLMWPPSGREVQEYKYIYIIYILHIYIYSTGQSPQWAVVPMEGGEERGGGGGGEEEEEEYIYIYTWSVLGSRQLKSTVLVKIRLNGTTVLSVKY